MVAIPLPRRAGATAGAGRGGALRPGFLLPIGIALAILALDWIEGPRVQFVGSLTSVPFLAAVFLGWAGTLTVGLTCLTLAAGFGLVQDTPLTSGLISHPQLIRLAFILAACLAASAAAAARGRREARLRSMTAVAEVARTVTLRPLEPQLGPVRCAASYPADPARRLVGGDIAELLDTPFGIRFVIGRASGGELSAVRCAGAVLAGFREQAARQSDLGRLCVWMDAAARAAADPGSGSQMAVLVGEIRRDGFVHVAGCGHAPALLIPASGDEPRVLGRSAAGEPEGQPLGELAGPPPVMSWRMDRGDRLVGCSARTSERADPWSSGGGPAGQPLQAWLDGVVEAWPGSARRRSLVLALEFGTDPAVLRGV